MTLVACRAVTANSTLVQQFAAVEEPERHRHGHRVEEVRRDRDDHVDGLVLDQLAASVTNASTRAETTSSDPLVRIRRNNRHFPVTQDIPDRAGHLCAVGCEHGVSDELVAEHGHSDETPRPRSWSNNDGIGRRNNVDRRQAAARAARTSTRLPGWSRSGLIRKRRLSGITSRGAS